MRWRGYKCKRALEVGLAERNPTCRCRVTPSANPTYKSGAPAQGRGLPHGAEVVREGSERGSEYCWRQSRFGP